MVEEMKSMSFEQVAIDSIITNNKYLRLNTDVSKLMKSIETVGCINPLIINKNYQLLAGGRRFTAMKNLGMDQVPVVMIEKNELEQELISIDENLVRLDLNKVEMEEALGRAKQIYDELHPGMPSMEEELEAEKANPEERLTNNETFLEYTAQKTGLSKKAIKGAIDREAKSSPRVKEARLHGELNASQTNELIKLDREDQEKLLEEVKGKSAADIKKIVKKAQQMGADQALELARAEEVLPKEYKNLKVMLNRMNKLSSKILLEEMSCDHPDKNKILEDIFTLRNQLDQLVGLMGASSNNDMDEDDVGMDGHEHFNEAAVHDQISEMHDR